MSAQDPTRHHVALITGAASGIGKATAIALARNGVRVIILDRNEEQAETVGCQIRDHGGQVEVLPCDLVDDEMMENVRRTLDERNIEIDLLISNAFIATGGSIHDLDLSTWQRGLDVNLLGSIRLLKAFLPAMMSRQRGHIVLVSSGLALLPKASAAQMLPYIAAKSALIGLAQALALSLPQAGIDVSLFCPALTATDSHRTGLGLNEDLVGAIDDAMGAASQPEDAAKILLAGIRDRTFLISSVPDFRDELIRLAENNLDPRPKSLPRGL